MSKTYVLVFFVLVATNLNAQFSCPDAKKCTSKDLEIVGAFLTAGQCFCSVTGTQTATLNMTINNTTGSWRTSFAFFGTLIKTNPDGTTQTSYLSGCGGPLAPGVPTTIPVSTNISYNCNQTLSLSNVFLAWTDASGAQDPNGSAIRCEEILTDACAHISPKCGVAPVIPIAPLLSLAATTTPGCSGASAGKIRIRPIGGRANYSVTLKKGTVTIGTQNNLTTTGYEFTGLVEGTDYSAIVTDAATPTACTYTSGAITLGSVFCCTPPAIENNPLDIGKCSGQTASFVATATGGNPTPSIQWQVKTTPAGSFTNINPVGPSAYSGFATNTLGISDVTGLNGYQFRAIFTSTDCTPATSNPATLTVTPNPTAGAGTAPASQCFVSGATGNTFNLSGNGSGGTQSWSVQSKNPNTLTAVITGGDTYTPSVKVTGTTEGTVTLRLSVSTASCGTATSDVSVTTLAVPSSPDVTYIAPTCTDATFKVTVNNPHTGSSYTLRQTTGGVGPITKTTLADVVAGKITFAGLTPGKGYRVTETNGGGCISLPESCGDFSGVTGARVAQTTIQFDASGESEATVKAYPNPFNDRIKFLVNSSVAGNGSLDVYNMMGQKIKTVYTGFIKEGAQTFELSLPKQQVANLVYVLRVGNKKVTGKILQIN